VVLGATARITAFFLPLFLLRGSYLRTCGGGGSWGCSARTNAGGTDIHLYGVAGYGLTALVPWVVGGSSRACEEGVTPELA